MRKLITIFGFINCLLAVILGAFAAHFLKTKISLSSLNTFEIGIRYQFYHGLAILIASLFAIQLKNNNYYRSAYLFLIGIILFSGSLYVIALKDLITINLKWIGPLTPVGGLFFISGWLMLIVYYLKTKNEQ